MVIWQEQFGVLVSTIIILSQLSVLWKDNPFFRWGTRIVVGYNVGASLPSFTYTMDRYVWQPMTGPRQEYWWLIAVALGLLLYTRLSRPHAWISKYPLGVQLGVGVGIAAVQMLRAQVIDPIAYTVSDIFTAVEPASLLNAIVIFVALVTVISYFLFTREHTGIIGGSAYVGRGFMMASIAVIWAGDYVWAMAMLAGTLWFLIRDFFRGLILGIPI